MNMNRSRAFVTSFALGFLIAQPTPAQESRPDAQPPAAADDLAPMVEIARQDYAEARRAFHTKLVREAPSPQPYEPVTAPVDAHEITYASGKLQLKAWVSEAKEGDTKCPGLLFLHGGFAF